jgi:hypothetical protein
MINGNVKQRGRIAEDPIKTVVVYNREKSKKYYISVFEGKSIEEIFDSSKRKPLIPNNFTITDAGVGESFITRYMKQYNVNKLTEL